jgi:hypothetical protein
MPGHLIIFTDYTIVCHCRYHTDDHKSKVLSLLESEIEARR